MTAMTLRRPGGTFPSLLVNLSGKAGVGIREELAGQLGSLLFTGLVAYLRHQSTTSQ